MVLRSEMAEEKLRVIEVREMRESGEGLRRGNLRLTFSCVVMSLCSPNHCGYEAGAHASDRKQVQGRYSTLVQPRAISHCSSSLTSLKNKDFRLLSRDVIGQNRILA